MDPTHYQPGDAAALRSIGRWCRRWLGLAGCPDDAECWPVRDETPPARNRPGRWPDAQSLITGRIAGPALGRDSTDRQRRGRDSEDA